jgi:hypothetical protein
MLRSKRRFTISPLKSNESGERPTLVCRIAPCGSPPSSFNAKPIRRSLSPSPYQPAVSM